jgi:uncharacterized membrane protein
MWHGIGLVISLVSGFGMVAKYAKLLPPDAPSYYTQPWVLIKFALWLVLGFLPVLAKRRVLAAPLVVLIAAVIGGVLGYIGYFKPLPKTYKTLAQARLVCEPNLEHCLCALSIHVEQVGLAGCQCSRWLA